ncbi:hypothetical protein BDD43_5682 [Mucilaginibacter gracilis]|uniref:Lipoprotein n=1 Tax=Mucilaginibacter gracilis TaxID=423350 RepID=A0A495J9P3_9SPHI|nr:hypothetical protein [Mucilaginibacter gracilis]RKR85411.1 hypothetical protein BDD43_5682 [Mucilaginibacter gracilis]
MKAMMFGVFVVATFFCSCTNTTTKQQIKKSAVKAITIDTTISFKISGTWVTPKKFFDFNSLQMASGDTLALVTCSHYVYSPFGNIKNKKQLKTSILNNFDIRNRTDSVDIGPVEFQILKLKSSKLIFFFDNDTEGSRHSFIIKGEINDAEVKFDKNISIGMSIESFYKTFFDYFPEELLHKYKVIVLVSCVDDIKHIYSFNNGSLASVYFITDTYWKVDY